MHGCTLDAFLPRILDSLLPPAGAILSAIALLVASRARSISRDEQRTLTDLRRSLNGPPEQRGHNESVTDALDRRKS